MVTIILFIQGYTVFLPGQWSTQTFFFYYAMIIVCAVLFIGWKVIKKTKFVKPEEADLVWDKPIIDAYEASRDPPLGIWEDIWTTFLAKTGLRKPKTQEGVEALG